MYTPAHNRSHDRDEQIRFMLANSFATLVTSGERGLTATHLPVMVEERGEDLFVVAHMARANPQWHDFGDHPRSMEAMVIFSGPHAYITPFLYDRDESVPTWNYIAVHAYGQPRIVESLAERAAVVERLIAQHDTAFLAKYRTLRSDYKERMLGGIVAFEIPVSRIDARFKLSQDKTPVEHSRIVASLAASNNSAAVGTALAMQAWASGRVQDLNVTSS